MVGSISYFNAELGTQSLLKINTKENPKAAKPIFIPFIFFFLLGALLSSSCYLVAGVPPRAHSESECGGVIPGPGHAAIDRKRGEEGKDLRTISLSEIYIKWDDGPLSETWGAQG